MAAEYALIVVQAPGGIASALVSRFLNRHLGFS